MDNRNTLIGSLLIGVLLIFFIFYSNKKRTEEETHKPRKSTTQTASPELKSADKSEQAFIASSDTNAQAQLLNDSLAAAQSTAAFGAFSESSQGESKLVVVETDFQKVTFNTKGGFIQSIELKEYKTWDKKKLILFDEKNTQFSYQFIAGENNIVNTSDLYFVPSIEGFKIKGDEKKSISFIAKAGDGFIEQKFSFTGNSYEVDYNLHLKGLENAIAPNNTFISATWNSTLPSLEKDLPTERRYSAMYFRYKDSDVEHLKDDGNEEQNISTPLERISFKQQFFNTTIISPKAEIKSGVLRTAHVNEELGYTKKFSARYTIPYRANNDIKYAFKIYSGPNHFQTLKGIGQEFQDILKLGPDFILFSWIKYITRFIIWVFGLFDSIHLNYGIIILLMTVFLKILLHPLTYKSYKSAASMKLLQPELAELKEKYGDDQTKIGQEQMKLYSKAGVSPFGGCLPLLLQMPILMAMYYFFPASIELRQQPFLWATDLSTYDAIVTFSTALPLIGSHISLFTVLMTITSVAQAVMNKNTNQMGAQQPGMQYLPYIMPVMLMFLFNSFPAALTYYYLLQNVIGMGQQWVIQKFFIDEDKLRKQMDDNKKNPKPKSGFQKRLEDMQRQAQTQQTAKKKK